MMRLTKHARKRMQQRGIRDALKRVVGRRMVKRHEKALNTFLVCAEDEIATVGHLYQRVVRH